MLWFILSICRFDPRAFRWALTMKLAVEEINNSSELLPNLTVGYKIFDSCAYPLTGQRAALAVMNGLNEAKSPMCSGASPMLAIIGESGSAQSIVVSRILQPFRIPMVSTVYIYCKRLIFWQDTSNKSVVNISHYEIIVRIL